MQENLKCRQGTNPKYQHQNMQDKEEMIAKFSSSEAKIQIIKEFLLYKGFFISNKYTKHAESKHLTGETQLYYVHQRVQVLESRGRGKRASRGEEDAVHNT